MTKRIWLSEKPIQGYPAVVECASIQMLRADAVFDRRYNDGERPRETLAHLLSCAAQPRT